ncbi:MAG: glycosyltransferase family 39 protein, partial [Novosphingobium sp.]|nr:glycosyltransferase family 39 protein [Novosphingobium sp.]
MFRFSQAETGPPPRAMPRWALAAVAIAMIAGLVIRARTGDYPMFRDELSSMVFASQPMSRLWSLWMVRETNPPLFYSMLRAWLALGARTVTEIRLLPNIGGAVAIGLVGALCARVSGAWAGVIGALLAAVSAEHVWYGQYIRGYIFETDGVLVSMLGLLAWLDGGRHARAGLVAYVLGAAFGFYCHVTLAVWPVAAGLAVAIVHWRALIAGRGGKAAEFILANLLLAGLCAWWLWIAAHQLSSDNIDHIKPMSVEDHLRLVWHNTILIRDLPPHTRVLRYALTLLIGL